MRMKGRIRNSKPLEEEGFRANKNNLPSETLPVSQQEGSVDWTELQIGL